MRELAYVCAQPTDKYFVWQVALWLQSLQDIGEDDKAHVVLFNPSGREVTEQWAELQDLFPKAKFKAYETSELNNWLAIYIPVIRPFVLAKYFEQNPELSKKAVFYCDSDVLFTKKPDIDKYLDDDICYLSNTISYIGSDYIIGKSRDVLPSMAEQFKKKDVLADMCKFVGITKETAIANNFNSGGAQYLLKDVDTEFWKKVVTDCVMLKMYLDSINKAYFKNGNEGYQSWCADMWAVLYNLWMTGKQTRVVQEMDFAWATDPIERLGRTSILHNAGVTSDSKLRTTIRDTDGKNKIVDAPAFYKGKFSNGTSPYSDISYLTSVATNEVSKQFCTSYYAEYMLKHKDKLWEIVKP